MLKYNELEILYCLLDATTGVMGNFGREKIQTCLDSPSLETWDEVHAFVLQHEPHINFAAAVKAVDPTFEVPDKVFSRYGRQFRPWKRVPTRNTLVEALKYAAYRWK